MVISARWLAQRQRVAWADLPECNRAGWRLYARMRGEAARRREQVVAPPLKLALGAAVEVQHVRRRVRQHVPRARPPRLLLHAHVARGGLAVHRLHEDRVPVERKPLLPIDEEMADDVLVVEAGRVRHELREEAVGRVGLWHTPRAAASAACTMHANALGPVGVVRLALASALPIHTPELTYR